MPMGLQTHPGQNERWYSIRFTSPFSDADGAKTKMSEGFFEGFLKLLAKFSIREGREGSPRLLSSPPVPK